MSAELTQAQLKEALHYDPETGVFTWAIRVSRKMGAGSVAGALTSSGSRQIKVGGALHLAHRLAFLYMTGEWPTSPLDHIDGNPGNNRWRNLRPCTPAENSQNQASVRRSRSGLLGAHWNSCNKNWTARITEGGANTHLGCFSAPEEAHQAYLAAKAKLHKFNPIPRTQ